MARSSNLDKLAIVNQFPITTSFSSTALDNATKTDGTHSDDQAAFAFTPFDSETLSEIWVNLSTPTGSPSTSNIVCDIFAANTTTNTAPTGASLGQATISSTAAGWRSFTGFSVSLTAGSRYFAVIRNKEGTPASNFILVSCNDAGDVSKNTFSYEPSYFTSTDGGATWTARRGVASHLAVFASGNSSGRPLGTTTTSSQIYNTRMYGIKYTIPSGISAPLAGAIFLLGTETGNPTGNVVAKVYNNTTLIATSLAIPDAIASNSFGFYTAIFDDTYLFSPSDTLRLVIGETTQSDASTDRHNISKFTTPETTASRNAWWGSPIETYYDGSSWTDGGGFLPILSPLIDITNGSASSGLPKLIGNNSLLG